MQAFFCQLINKFFLSSAGYGSYILPLCNKILLSGLLVFCSLNSNDVRSQFKNNAVNCANIFNFPRTGQCADKTAKTGIPFWEMGKQNKAGNDSASLKQSGWYANALKNIDAKEYEISFNDLDKTYSSPNRAHNLRGFYSNDQFSITPRNDSDEQWKLTLQVKGIFHGRNKIYGLSKKPGIIRSAYTIRFNNDDQFATEYVNSKEGVRQNFIINKEPVSKPQTINVKLQTTKGWFINRVNDNEIHFARRALVAKATKTGYDKKITYNSLKVWDATNRKLAASFAVNHNTISIDVQTQNAVYPITIDPISTTAAAMVESNQANSKMGYAVSSAGDVNGDGYSDVIVGAYQFDNGQTDEGAAFIYHGSATGISTTFAVMVESNQASANLGWSVASAGDVNGDGYSDVIAGALNYDNGQSNEGAAFIYHGSASGLSTTAATTIESNQANALLGTSVALAGDVNGDGYSDVIVGASSFDNGQTDEGAAFVYHGSASGINSVAAAMLEMNQANARLGCSVASAGDVNGDGYSDVVAGAYFYDNGETDEGGAFIYHGSVSGINTVAVTSLESNQVNGYFGVSVAAAGDVNGDGYSDVIIGSSGYDNGETDEGAAFIYHGSAGGISTTISTTLESNQVSAGMGISVASAGDVNGDGYSDVISGAYSFDNGETNEGAAFIYYGSSVGINTTAAAMLESNQVSAFFGYAVASAGDVNGDGYSDVIAGAYFFDNGQTDEGAAFVYHGGANGISTTIATQLESNQSNAYLGWSVSSAGDVNGDGYSDIIVGAYLFDNGQTDEGAAFVYHGSATGINTTIAAQLECNQASANFGYSVASAGDVNGDGYSDVIVGARFYDNVQNNEGAGLIYHGSVSGINTTVATIVESNQNGGDMGRSVASAGDVNGDGYGDIIVGASGWSFPESGEGAAFIYHGSATGINIIAARVLESNQANALMGISVACAGDVNGDGYSDVVVGAYQFDNGQTDEGAAFIYYGSATGIGAVAAATLESNQAIANFGRSVSGAGDVNGDGFSDIIVGAFQYDNGETDEGTAFIYYGSITGINTTPAIMLEADQASDGFGYSVASAGDVNGDGYSDVIIGARNGNIAYVYQGSASGINIASIALAVSLPLGNALGWSVASAGDVNGDGFSDVIVGAPAGNNGQANEGTAFVFLGNNGGGKRSNLRLYNTDLVTPIQQSNRLVPNLFGAGLYAKSPLGRVKGRLVWEVKAQGIPFSGNPITNSTAYYDRVTSYANLGIAGTELKSNVQKRGLQTKIRARVEYSKATAITGQVYGPWRYPAGYTQGAYGMNSVPLPLTLIAFNGQFINADDVQLQWVTANELNLQSFVVERSMDGISFTTAGELTAKGSGSNRANYSLTDKNVKGNLLYYRLKLKEQNGDISYSNIITLGRNKITKGFIAPNPVQQGSNVMLILLSPGDKNAASINIFNTAGQLVFTGNKILQKGKNEIPLSTRGLATGVYVVNVVADGVKENYRLIVQ